MIGDTAAGILAGRAAGTCTCGVLYGHGSRTRPQAASPDHLISVIDEFSAVPE